jgi:hypothetical protein
MINQIRPSRTRNRIQVFMLGHILLYAIGCSAHHAPAAAPNRARLHAELDRIARQGSSSDEMRNRFRNSHLTQNLPESLWTALFPPSTEGYQLLFEGRALSVPDARYIAEDPSESPAVRENAAMLYGYFDAYWYLQWLAEMTYPNRDSQIALKLKLRELLPAIPNEIAYPNDDLTHEWLKAELDRQPDFKSLILSRFDQIMSPFLSPQEDGLIDEDPRLLKWFNRFDDVDLDEWLAKRDPTSLECRRRILRERGVDPLILSAGTDSERRAILHASLPSREADAAFQLLNRVNPNHAGEWRPPSADRDWRIRVCAWYWANRKAFRYDPNLRRFVLSGVN